MKFSNILVVADYFVPGYIGGGPIRTIDNMRRQLAGVVTLSVITRDRDLGALAPYTDISPNRWSETKDGPVFYASPETFGLTALRRALNKQKFDAIYLNSFFGSRSSILLYLYTKIFYRRLPILIAPRGEFSDGALSIKKFKKRAFLLISKLLGWYRDVEWHASTPFEAKDILRQFSHAQGHVHIASDPVVAEPSHAAPDWPAKRLGHLRLIFISRISPMKNVVGLLEMLRKVKASVELDIFGPIEDLTYWERCEETMALLPTNITVRAYGPISSEKVFDTFSHYDLFAFPTHGENFGHVVFEALSAGTPVLISDQTPWQSDEAGAVTVIPLNNTASWCDAIEKAANRSEGAQFVLRNAALNYSKIHVTTDGSRQANVEMFRALTGATTRRDI
jgi:glycosyltransferase involved in cell wall biosynthesis